MKKPKDKKLQGTHGHRDAYLSFYVDSRIHIGVHDLSRARDPHRISKLPFVGVIRLSKSEAVNLHDWIGRAIAWGGQFK